MHGVVITGNRTVEVQAFADPSPGPGEVVIAVRASGICGTDRHRFRAEPEAGEPVIAGHEPSGVVVALGKGVAPTVAVTGQRVMVHHYEGCGHCSPCRSGWTQMCETPGAMRLHGRTAHGSHAPYMKVPAYSIIPLDDALSFEAGAAIGCGTGTAWGALERLQITGRETLAIFGQGPVGASATMIASAAGVRVIALDVKPERLELARRFGAWRAIDPTAADAVELIGDATNGKGVDAALETSGSDAAAEQALAVLRNWGRGCFLGMGSRFTIDVTQIMRRQLTVLTSWTLSHPQQRQCAEFVRDRRLDIDALFSDRWRLEDAQAAFVEFDKQRGGKGVFIMR